MRAFAEFMYVFLQDHSAENLIVADYYFWTHVSKTIVECREMPTAVMLLPPLLTDIHTTQSETEIG